MLQYLSFFHAIYRNKATSPAGQLMDLWNHATSPIPTSPRRAATGKWWFSAAVIDEHCVSKTNNLSGCWGLIIMNYLDSKCHADMSVWWPVSLVQPVFFNGYLYFVTFICFSLSSFTLFAENIWLWLGSLLGWQESPFHHVRHAELYLAVSMDGTFILSGLPAGLAR